MSAFIMDIVHRLPEFLRQMSPIEWAGALTALVCIYLTVKNRIENWPWGIISVLLYTKVFLDTRLYANAGLQVFYFLPCCIWGWWVWAKWGPKKDDDLTVTDLTPTMRIRWLLIAALLSACVGFPIAHFTNDPMPYSDSISTGISIVAQYLQAKKVYENWWMWIGVDLLYAFYILPKQGLWVSAVLYGIFTLLAIQGARAWKPLIGKEVIKRFEVGKGIRL